MNTKLISIVMAGAVYASFAVVLPSCGKEPAGGGSSTGSASGSSTGTAGKGSNAKGDDHGHSHGKNGDHDHDHADGHNHGDGHSHGEAVALGDAVAGEYTVIAKREGEIKAGSDVGFDITVVGPADGYTAVRVWVGVESGDGSMKARADRTGETWHAHAEAPAVLPEGSKVWVELELKSGDKLTASFDIK